MTYGFGPLQTVSERPACRREFREALVVFVNEILPDIHGGRVPTEPVDAETRLFEDGVIDSLAILHLIGFVEWCTGETIPARMVVMKHFGSIARIAETFRPEESR